MTRFKHLHLSTRFDRPPITLWRFILAYVGFVSIITLTEVSNNARVERLKKLKGWKFIQVTGMAGEDECAILVKLSKWIVAETPYTWGLTKERIPIRNARCFATVAVLEHKRTGKKLNVSVAHLPVPRDKYTRLQNKEAMVTWETEMWDEFNTFKYDVLGTGDWNLNWRDPHIREVLKFIFKWGRWTWGKRMPIRGTHEKRVIDYSVTTCRVVRARVLRIWRASDHKGFIEVLEF